MSTFNQIQLDLSDLFFQIESIQTHINFSNNEESLNDKLLLNQYFKIEELEKQIPFIQIFKKIENELFMFLDFDETPVFFGSFASEFNSKSII